MGRLKRVQRNATCEVCGNSHGELFEVRLGREKHVFDSFECAIYAFTPKCDYCGGQIAGHGVKLGTTFYCSLQCANDDSTGGYEARVILKEQTNL